MIISMTYLLMAMKIWSLDDEYIVYRMISYLRLTMVLALTYGRIEYNKNKCLVRCIYKLNIKTLHDIIEILNYITYIKSLIFVQLIEDKYIIDYITT